MQCCAMSWIANWIGMRCLSASDADILIFSMRRRPVTVHLGGAYQPVRINERHDAEIVRQLCNTARAEPEWLARQ